MDTSIKLNKDFLKLLDCIRVTDPNQQNVPVSRIHCKENVLFVTNNRMALQCDLKQEQLPKFELVDGYYEVSGKYLVQDKEIEGEFPDANHILNTDHTEYFRITQDTEITYLSFIHTLSHHGFYLNYVKYEKQFKQVFKGSDFTVFLEGNDRMALIEFSYSILTFAPVMADVSFFVMPMVYELPEIKGVKYNPSKDKKPFPTKKENLV